MSCWLQLQSDNVLHAPLTCFVVVGNITEAPGADGHLSIGMLVGWRLKPADSPDDGFSGTEVGERWGELDSCNVDSDGGTLLTLQAYAAASTNRAL